MWRVPKLLQIVTLEVLLSGLPASGCALHHSTTTQTESVSNNHDIYKGVLGKAKKASRERKYAESGEEFVDAQAKLALYRILYNEKEDNCDYMCDYYNIVSTLGVIAANENSLNIQINNGEQHLNVCGAVSPWTDCVGYGEIVDAANEEFGSIEVVTEQSFIMESLSNHFKYCDEHISLYHPGYYFMQ